MTFPVILVLLLAHFVGDFLLQTDWQATHKSRNWRALGAHGLTYTLVLAVLMLCGASPWWVAVNGLAHVATAAGTSRISAYCWTHGQRHRFFVVIGADQTHSLRHVDGHVAVGLRIRRATDCRTAQRWDQHHADSSR